MASPMAAAERRFMSNYDKSHFQHALLSKLPVQDFYMLTPHQNLPSHIGTPDSVLAMRETPPLDTTPPPPALDREDNSPLLSGHASNHHHHQHNSLESSPHGWNDEFMEDQFSMIYDEMVHAQYFSRDNAYTHLFKDPLVWANGPVDVGIAQASIEEEESKIEDNTDVLHFTDDHEAIMQHEYADIKMEQPASAETCSVEAELRNYIKGCLDKQLKEEMALCGCDRVLEKEKDYQKGGKYNSQDHQLKCKMRRDYGLWAMWMEEKANRNEGLNLVQRLLACAEAVACRDARQAQSLLLSVQELASPYGDSLQRVAFCFMEGLAARLDQHNVAGNNSSSTQHAFPFSLTGHNGINKQNNPSLVRLRDAELIQEDLRKQQQAFHFLCEVCPYVPFGHFFANSVILEAFQGEDAVHVIDIGMVDGLQWPALICALATRDGGPPKLLRITGVISSTCRLRVDEEEVGEALRHKAKAVGVNLEFKVVRHPLESMATAPLGLREGEAVAVNSLLQLHCVVKESRGSLNTVLQAIHGLAPKVLTLVEQDANHNGPFFLGRFMEALHYYSAIFDSLQSAHPEQYNTRRVMIEQCHLAREIGNIVACEGPTRVERHERVDQWRRRMSRAGFQLAPNRLESQQARLWLSTYYERHAQDYTLSDEKGCLVLGWKGKPIIAASAWRC